MHFDGGLGLAEMRPWKDRQAQIDSRGVEGVHRVVEFEAKILVGIEVPSGLDQRLGKIGVDAPVAFFVGFGQGAAGDIGSNAHMVERVALGFEAGFDIAQALPIGELSECHAAVLILTAEALDVPVAIVALSAASKGMQRQMIHCLCENKFARVHRLIAPIRNTGLKRDSSDVTGSSR